jgi:hypothetical protein
VLCHRFVRRAGRHQQSTGVDGVWGQKACTKRKRNCSQLLRPLTNHDKIKSKSYRIVCSTQPEESGNKEYDDHDADDVKNVHCTLRLRHARLQYKARCSNRRRFGTILSSGVHETKAQRRERVQPPPIRGAAIHLSEFVLSACHRQQKTSRVQEATIGTSSSISVHR